MSGYTAGPWHIEYAETGVRWPTIYVDDPNWDGGRREIAELSSHVAKRTRDNRWRRTSDADEAEANARLIAAAPDLLDALKAFTSGGDFDPDDEAVKHAQAAIAKAEGK